MAPLRWTAATSVLVLALALVACGDRDPSIDVGDDGLADEDAEPDLDDADDPDPADDEGEDADEGDGDDWELTAHRPPDDLGAVADCDAVANEDPGAFIAFPSAEGPDWLDAGDGPVTVEFVGCSNTFEANLVYEAYHGSDATPTLTGHTMGGSYGDWARFGFEETFWTPGEWTVVVLEIDAASGDRRDYDEVTFTVG